MLKGAISIFLAVCILFCLAGCGATVNISNENNAPSEQQSDTYQETEETVQTKPKNNEASSETEDSKVNDTAQTQTPTNPSKSTSTTNQPTHTHSYSEASCTSPKKCACGATAGAALGHQFSAATCTSPQICSRCGNTNGNALGHDYSDANCNLPKTCTRCGNTQGNALGHKYVNNSCSRCGNVDPNSLPVGLEELHVIDYSFYNSYFMYSYIDGSFTDSFGNTYDGVHFYNGLWEKKYSIHNLGCQYATFQGSIVASSNTLSGSTYCIEIYVDNVLKYAQEGFSKLSGKVDFSINVKGGSQLKIVAYDNGGASDVTGMEIGIVNAQLLK